MARISVKAITPITTSAVQKITVSTASRSGLPAWARTSSRSPPMIAAGIAVPMTKTDSRDISARATGSGKAACSIRTTFASTRPCGLQPSRQELSSVQHSEQIGPA
ncbi:hypothetical protein [Rhodovulum sp.]|uniref:hypothetical protein n=1 Tax=Rhodovulum sp. TaxID=34009 RepID=UPI00178E0C02|nr:hypothetical protein [Rhodovulum sp.]HDR27428.1 hypothetical protein [Rhodovulum sp.]